MAIGRYRISYMGAVLLTIVTLFMAFQPRRPGLNLWADFVTGLSQSTVVTGPLAAGFAAIVVSSWTKSATPRIRVATKSGWLILLRALNALLVPLLVSFPLSVFLVGIYSYLTGTYGAPHPPWLLCLWACSIGAIGFGASLGFVLAGRWYVAPLASLLFLGGHILASSLDLRFGVRSLFPTVVNQDTEFAIYFSDTMLAQAALFISVSALMVVLAFQSVTRKLARSASLTVLLLLFSIYSGALVLNRNGQYLTGFNHRDFVCGGDALVICLNRGYADGLHPLSEAFTTPMNRVDGTPLAPALLEQNVQGVGDEPSQGARSIYIESIDEDGISLAVYRYFETYGGVTSCMESTRTTEQVLATLIVTGWLAGYDEVGFSESPKSSIEWQKWNGLHELSEHVAIDWFNTHYVEFMDCTLTLSDLP